MRQSDQRKLDRSEPGTCSSASNDETEDWIGRQLRELYDETLNEPIPDRLLDLLKQIERKDTEPE